MHRKTNEVDRLQNQSDEYARESEFLCPPIDTFASSNLYVSGWGWGHRINFWSRASSAPMLRKFV
jgi:hypothetical protein